MKRILILAGASGRLGQQILNQLDKRYTTSIALDLKTDVTNNVISVIDLDRALANLGTRGEAMSVDVIFAQRHKDDSPSHSKPSVLDVGDFKSLEAEIVWSLELIEKILNNINVSPGSNILFISSTNSVTVSGQSLAYHISKAAAVSCVKWLAERLAPKAISVKGVAFGILVAREKVKTDHGVFSAQNENTDQKQHNEKLNIIATKLMIGSNLISYTEAARFCGVLLDKSSFCLTGQTVTFDGGYGLSDPYHLLGKFSA